MLLCGLVVPNKGLAQTITGPSPLCIGTTPVTYSVPVQTGNLTKYVWILSSTTTESYIVGGKDSTNTLGQRLSVIEGPTLNSISIVPGMTGGQFSLTGRTEYADAPAKGFTLRNITIPYAEAGEPKELSCATPSVTIGNPGFQNGVLFKWTGPNGYTSTVKNPVVTVPGTYVLTVTSGSCSNTDEVVVTSTITPGQACGPVMKAIPNRTQAEMVALTLPAATFDAVDGDTPAGSLLYTMEDLPEGAVFNPSTKVFTWTPTEAQGPNVYLLTARVSDGTLDDTVQFKINVTEANRTPVVDQPAPQIIAVGQELTFQATATDPDLPAQQLFFSLSNYSSTQVVPPGATVTPEGHFSWTPTNATVGRFNFNMGVRDEKNAGHIRVFNTTVNAAPVLNPIGDKTAAVGELLTFSLLGSDINNEGQGSQPMKQARVFSLVDAPTDKGPISVGTLPGGDYTGAENVFTRSTSTIRGAFSWTPSEPGTYTFKIRLSDNGAVPQYAEEEITVVVSNAYTLTITPPTNGTISATPAPDQNGKYTSGTVVTLTATAASGFRFVGWTGDASGNTNPVQLTMDANKTVSANFEPIPTYTLTITETVNGSISTSPVPNSEGKYSDGTNVILTAVPAEGYRFVSWGGAVSGNSVTTVVTMDADKTVSASFEAIAPVTYALVLTQPSNGSISAEPEIGPYTAGTEVTLTATANTGYDFAGWSGDATGTVNPLVLTMDEDKNVSATFTKLNTAPVLASIGNKNAIVGQDFTFDASATDSDDGQTLAYTLENAPEGASINGTTGSFNWTPAAAGLYTFTVRVADNGSPIMSDSEVITVTVAAANTAPLLAAIGDKSIEAGQQLSFTATATDADEGQTLSFSLENAPDGATINSSSGAFSWTPAIATSATFVVKVSDNGSPVLTDQEQITVVVTEPAPVNTAPLLMAIGNKSVIAGQELSFTAQATDADGDDLSFTLEGTVPAGASINSSTGAFSWTPTITGSVSFTIKVSDNGAPVLTDEEEITVTVTAANTAPILASIGDKTVTTGQQLTFTASAIDAEEDVLTYSLENAPSGAEINSETGSFTWTPGVAGTVTFIVKVSDNGSPVLTDQEEISIVVTAPAPVNTAPVLASIGNKSAQVNQPLSFTASATDAENDNLTYSLVGAPSTASINASTGAFTWTPPFTGSATFTVKVTDNGTPALSDEEQITVTVSNPTAATAIRINAGGGSFNASGNRAFIADAYFGGTDRVSSLPSGNILNTTDDVLYRTERSAPAFNYSIPVQNGTVEVVLHFAEIWFGVPGRGTGGANRRKFHVNIEGVRKLTNYDIFAVTGGALRAVQETFTVNVTDGTLNIDFLSGTANMPKISAIEVLPQGAGLTATTSAALAGVEDRTDNRAGMLSVYPNPANPSERVSVEMSNIAAGEEVTLILQDMRGRVIHTSKMVASIDGTLDTDLLLNNLSRGVYIVSVHSKTVKVNSKLVVR